MSYGNQNVPNTHGVGLSRPDGNRVPHDQMAAQTNMTQNFQIQYMRQQSFNNTGQGQAAHVSYVNSTASQHHHQPNNQRGNQQSQLAAVQNGSNNNAWKQQNNFMATNGMDGPNLKGNGINGYQQQVQQQQNGNHLLSPRAEHIGNRNIPATTQLPGAQHHRTGDQAAVNKDTIHYQRHNFTPIQGAEITARRSSNGGSSQQNHNVSVHPLSEYHVTLSHPSQEVQKQHNQSGNAKVEYVPAQRFNGIRPHEPQQHQRNHGVGGQNHHRPYQNGQMPMTQIPQAVNQEVRNQHLSQEHRGVNEVQQMEQQGGSSRRRTTNSMEGQQREQVLRERLQKVQEQQKQDQLRQQQHNEQAAQQKQHQKLIQLQQKLQLQQKQRQLIKQQAAQHKAHQEQLLQQQQFQFQRQQRDFQQQQQQQQQRMGGPDTLNNGHAPVQYSTQAAIQAQSINQNVTVINANQVQFLTDNSRHEQLRHQNFDNSRTLNMAYNQTGYQSNQNVKQELVNHNYTGHQTAVQLSQQQAPGNGLHNNQNGLNQVNPIIQPVATVGDPEPTDPFLIMLRQKQLEYAEHLKTNPPDPSFMRVDGTVMDELNGLNARNRQNFVPQLPQQFDQLPRGVEQSQRFSPYRNQNTTEQVNQRRSSSIVKSPQTLHDNNGQSSSQHQAGFYKAYENAAEEIESRLNAERSTRVSGPASAEDEEDEDIDVIYDKMEQERNNRTFPMDNQTAMKYMCDHQAPYFSLNQDYSGQTAMHQQNSQHQQHQQQYQPNHVYQNRNQFRGPNHDGFAHQQQFNQHQYPPQPNPMNMQQAAHLQNQQHMPGQPGQAHQFPNHRIDPSNIPNHAGSFTNPPYNFNNNTNN